MTMKEWKKSSLYRPRAATPEELRLLQEMLGSIGTDRPKKTASGEPPADPAIETIQSV